VGLIAPALQGILASVRSAFKSLKDVPVEEIVILSNYPSCWLNVEYSEATWEHAWAFVSSVTVVLKAGESSVASRGASAVVDWLLSSDREALENE